MLDIQKKAINKLVAALDGAKAQYRIILPDGTEYGTLEVKQVKAVKEGSRASPYPRGELKAYALPFLENLKPGEVAEVPCGEYEKFYISSACSSTAYDLWGKGGSMCSRNGRAGNVEVMRLV